MKKAELSFLHATLRVDLFYSPTKYHLNNLMVVELCYGNESKNGSGEIIRKTMIS